MSSPLTPPKRKSYHRRMEQLTLAEPEEPTPIPHGTHYGCGWDGTAHRATALRDYARAPEFVGPKFKTPREAIAYSDALEDQRGEA